MSKERISITYTALIWTGIILVLFGAISAVLGLGGATFFEASFGEIKIKTTQTGLAILFVGALLSGFIAIKLPKGVVVLDKEEKYTFTERLARKIPILALIIAAIAIVLLVLSFL